MTKSVIWYLHHYAGSPSLGMSYRPYYLSHEFNRHGYKAFIISASYHHLLNVPIECEQAVKHQKVDDQDFIFLKTPYYKNAVVRVLNMLTYAWKIWRYQRKLIQITGIPTVIIVSSAHPFHYFSARRIAKKYKSKLIFEVRDLWPLSLIELANLSPRNPLVLFAGLIEKAAYKQADYVVSLLPNALNYMKEKGISADQFVYISNGTDDVETSQYPVLKKYEQCILDLKKQGRFLLGYAGAHGVPNSLVDLIQALVILKQEKFNDIHVVCVGNGCQKTALMKLAEDHALDSVTFLDSIPKNQVSSFLALMDALYLGWKNRPIYQYGVSPNKLFDYMLSAKPILHAFTARYDIVKQHQCGITVDAENPLAIAQGIKQMVGMSKDELDKMGQNGKHAVLSSFTYAVLAHKYMKLFSLI